MGQAEILGNLGDGLYTILVKRNRAFLDARLARIAEVLTNLEEKRAELQVDIDAAQEVFEEILGRIDDIIDEMSDPPASSATLTELQNEIDAKQEQIEENIQRIAEIDALLPTLDPVEDADQITSLTAERAGLVSQNETLNSEIAALEVAYQEHIDGLNEQYLETMQEAYEARVERDKLNVDVGYVDLDMASLKARQNRLNELAYNIDNDMRSVWCADLSDELTGTVSTMEVIGQPTHILIAPQQRETGQNLPHGTLTPIIPMSPAQAAFNWAILPGWQKWRPTYRTAIISNIDTDADTCNVSIDGAWSVAQSLHVNQESMLTGVPVEYMDCNAAAFEEGDHVVVEFKEQKWEQPVVVGFVTEPKPCDDINAFSINPTVGLTGTITFHTPFRGSVLLTGAGGIRGSGGMYDYSSGPPYQTEVRMIVPGAGGGGEMRRFDSLKFEAETTLRFQIGSRFVDIDMDEKDTTLEDVGVAKRGGNGGGGGWPDFSTMVAAESGPGEFSGGGGGAAEIYYFLQSYPLDPNEPRSHVEVTIVKYEGYPGGSSISAGAGAPGSVNSLTGYGTVNLGAGDQHYWLSRVSGGSGGGGGKGGGDAKATQSDGELIFVDGRARLKIARHPGWPTQKRSYLTEKEDEVLPPLFGQFPPEAYLSRGGIAGSDRVSVRFDYPINGVTDNLVERIEEHVPGDGYQGQGHRNDLMNFPTSGGNITFIAYREVDYTITYD